MKTENAKFVNTGNDTCIFNAFIEKKNKFKNSKLKGIMKL